MELALSKKYRAALNLQKVVSYINFPWFGTFIVGLLYLLGGYRCENVGELRSRVRAMLDEVGDRPLVICSNHLTMIDSMLISTFLFFYGSYMYRFRLFPWNVPEVLNFGKNLPLRIMCYLGKCVFVERGGTLRSKKLTWEKLRYLVEQRELVCIFPEGGRSRSGRVEPENSVYGVGHLLQEVGDCHVLCVYLRGEGQKFFSFFPARKETFHVDVRMIRPRTEHSGRRGARDMTLQAMNQIKDMEDQYLAGGK